MVTGFILGWNHDGDCRVRILQAAIITAQGHVRVIEAMLAHPNHAGLQETGCGALCNLAFSSAHKVRDHNFRPTRMLGV